MSSYFYFFIKGLITGITIATIGGPVGILCVRRTLSQGISSGVALGIGAALADALFGSISGFGLTAISDFLTHHKQIINIIGSCFLIILGITTFFESTQKTVVSSSGLKKDFLKNLSTSFFITITNPATIIFFAAISVSLGIGLNNYTAASTMVSGIFFGSLIWFSSLSMFVSLFKTKITENQLLFINKIFGLGLLGFGLFVGLKNLL